mgnify:CR=1 FL=1|tara:strand:- start:518 stop:1093 length:576 start_codon:yes stop_codon:yes gene_type:complete
MTDYAYDDKWSTKNALADSAALKVVDADEFHTEFGLIETAIATKSNKASNLSDLTDKPAAIVNLGFTGATTNVASTSVEQTWTKQQRPLTADLTFNATQTWDCALAQDARLTLANNVTAFSAPTNQVAGSYYTLRVNNGSGPYSISGWNAVFKFPGGTDPTSTATASAIDLFVFRSDGTNMELIGQSQDVK